MLYEFTFRRFFDEAYSDDNLLKYDEKSKASFSSFIKSMSQGSEGKEEITTEMGADEVKTTSQQIESEIKRLKEEVPLSGHSSLNAKITANLMNICQNSQQGSGGGTDVVFNKVSNKSKDLKENRNDEKAPIFV